MITIKKDSSIYRLLTIYGAHNPYDLYKITDICALSKAVMLSLVSVFFITAVSVIIISVIIWPAVAWIFFLMMGFSLANPDVVTSLFMFTLCVIVAFVFYTIKQYVHWKERKEYEMAVNPRPPTLIQEWMASIKGKYCARIKFEE